MKTMFQCRTSTTSCQHDSIIINTHILGINDFISLYILQHTILMDRQQIDLFVSVHTNLYFIATETFIGKTLFFCTNSALRRMPYNGFEKYFIRETESRLASGYQSTEKMPRRSFPKAPFSADAYHPNCPFIGQAKAGLLTRPRRNAFPTPQDQWQKSVAAIHPGIRNTARKRADHLGSSGRTHSSGNCRRLSLRSHLI